MKVTRPSVLQGKGRGDALSSALGLHKTVLRDLIGLPELVSPEGKQKTGKQMWLCTPATAPPAEAGPRS